MSVPLNAKNAGSKEGRASFAFSNRVYRALWSMSWLALAAWTPPQLHFWRRFIVILFGGQIARTARIYGSVRIWNPRNLMMLRFSVLGPNVNCYNMDLISIGEYATISQGSHLCCGSHSLDNANFQLIVRPIVVGDYAWIAADAFVGPGVTIGAGAVLAARGVAMKSIPEWHVYIGNPAVFLKTRSQSILFT